MSKVDLLFHGYYSVLTSNHFFYSLFYADGLFTSIVSLSFSERVGAKVVECACVIELPELKV